MANINILSQNAEKRNSSKFYTDYRNEVNFHEGQMYFGKKNELVNGGNEETIVIVYITKTNKKTIEGQIVEIDMCHHSRHSVKDEYFCRSYDFNEHFIKMDLVEDDRYPANYQVAKLTLGRGVKPIMLTPLKAYYKTWFMN